jgi:Mrp family chromosome partitioning ATPase
MVAGIKRVMVIVSGTGGGGKPLVTGLLAVTLQRQGDRLGIVDRDSMRRSVPRPTPDRQ